MVLLYSGILACSDRDDDVGAVNIRIRNSSDQVFDSVQVGQHETLLLKVSPGDYSEYLEFETAYRYAFIEIRSAGESYVLQPNDFVGEEELPIGFYTYGLNITGDGDVVLLFAPD